MFDGCYVVYATLGLSILFCLGIFLFFDRKWYVLVIFPIPICFGLLLILSMSDFSPNRPSQNPYIANRVTVVSLRTSDQVLGDFVLGSGSIKEQTYYVYYTQDDDGAYRINKVLANQCKIYMEDRNDGELQTIYSKVDDDRRRYSLNPNWFDHYELHVPKGSIIQQYKIE